MDYQRIYNQLVSKRQSILVEGYTEKHHIIPRCMGGTDKPKNLVKLTAREHFVAHQLLAKIHMLQSLIFSAYMMSNYSKCTSKQYEWLKIIYVNKGGLYHKGKTYEEIMGEDKAKQLKYKRKLHMIEMNSSGIAGGKGNSNPIHKSQSGKDDIFYIEKSNKAYKTRRDNGNDTHSEETKKKISDSQKGKSKPKPNEETRRKMSESAKNRKRKI